MFAPHRVQGRPGCLAVLSVRISLSDDDTGLLELMAPLQEVNQELIDVAALRTPHVQEGLIHACLG